MSIRFVSGNILESSSDIWVNPTNTFGVMGAGLALKFKQRFPDYFVDYALACAEGRHTVDHIHVWSNEGLPKAIISLATKTDFRKKSTLDYVARGLNSLDTYLRSNQEHTSISIPAIGTGLGGLNWTDVKYLIQHVLYDVPMDVIVYEPY